MSPKPASGSRGNPPLQADSQAPSQILPRPLPLAPPWTGKLEPPEKGPDFFCFFLLLREEEEGAEEDP